MPGSLLETRWMILLWRGSFGTIAEPESPPARMLSSVSSLKEASWRSGPWQAKQRSRRSVLTCFSYSIVGLDLSGPCSGA